MVTYNLSVELIVLVPAPKFKRDLASLYKLECRGRYQPDIIKFLHWLLAQREDRLNRFNGGI